MSVRSLYGCLDRNVSIKDPVYGSTLVCMGTVRLWAMVFNIGSVGRSGGCFNIGSVGTSGGRFNIGSVLQYLIVFLICELK